MTVEISGDFWRIITIVLDIPTDCDITCYGVAVDISLSVQKGLFHFSRKNSNFFQIVGTLHIEFYKRPDDNELKGLFLFYF